MSKRVKRKSVRVVRRFMILLLLVFFQIYGFSNSMEPEVSWFNVKLNGNKVGYYSVETRTPLGGTERIVEKKEKMYLLLIRMNNQMVVDSVLERRFDKDFNLLDFNTRVSEGNVKRKNHGYFDYEEGNIKLQTEINGTSQNSKIGIVKDALSELQVLRRVKEKGFKIGDSFAYTAFLPDICSYVTCRMKIAAREDLSIMGTKRILYRLEREVEGMAHRLSIWVDSELSPWLSELIWPKQTYRLERTSKEDALSLKQIYSNRMDIFEEAAFKLRLADNIDLDMNALEGQVERVVYRISNAPSCHMFHGGVQGIIPGENESSFLMEICTDTSSMYKIPEGKLKSLNLTPYLASGNYIQSNNKKIKDIAESLIDENSRLSTVLKIKKWVSGRIKWCSDYGFSTAISTLESGCGDCTEFSVLTAALCRSIDIPSRLAMGYLVKEKFSGEKILAPHMWVEVLIRNSWYPVDSTSDSQDVDPFRIRFLASAMNQNEMYRFFDLYTTFSSVDVQFVSLVKRQKSKNLDIKNKNSKKGG